MVPPSGSCSPPRPGTPSQVVQGFFPGGRPRLDQASRAPAAPARPQAPAPVQARPAFAPPALVLPGQPAAGVLQPALRPGQAPGPIVPTVGLQPRPVQPATPQRARVPQPILPQAPRPLAVQPQAGNAFSLPAHFMFRPRGSGQPLPEPIQKKMEAFFNTNFADVRVHVGHEAASIGALAFTHGTDLYFAPGQYNPQSTQGQQLLGHELTHVGVPTGQWVRECEQDRYGIYRYIIKDTNKIALSIPSGHESQAYGSWWDKDKFVYGQWEPGGSTSGGKSESVIEALPREKLLEAIGKGLDIELDMSMAAQTQAVINAGGWSAWKAK